MKSSAVLVVTRTQNIKTQGNTDILDVTEHIQSHLESTKLKNGVVTVFVSGSTAGLTTVEYEPGLIKDLKRFFERLAPQNERYAHEEAWHDGNGHSHVRASFLGPSLSIPFSNRKLMLGTWQQCILIDFDNRQRNRDIIRLRRRPRPCLRMSVAGGCKLRRDVTPLLQSGSPSPPSFAAGEGELPCWYPGRNLSGEERDYARGVPFCSL